jgi:hypothetical protein
MSAGKTVWYHGGVLNGGQRKRHLFVTTNWAIAKEHADDPKHKGKGKVYRLRPKYHYLVIDYIKEDDEGEWKAGDVIEDAELQKFKKGALSVFVEVKRKPPGVARGSRPSPRG